MRNAPPESSDPSTVPRARLAFMRIDPETTKLLSEFWPHVGLALPDILDQFYRHVTSEPRLAQLIGNETARLKSAQSAHWERLFSGRFDAEYFASARAVGLVHARIGLEPRWYIGGYNFVLVQLSDLAGRVHRFSPGRARKVTQALVTAVLLDMEVAISVYQERLMEEAGHRSGSIDALARGFEATATVLLSSMSAAAHEMVTSARELSVTAKTSSEQAATVASAGEETSANVQTVAASAEELSACPLFATVRHYPGLCRNSTGIPGYTLDNSSPSGRLCPPLFGLMIRGQLGGLFGRPLICGGRDGATQSARFDGGEGSHLAAGAAWRWWG
ncbi:MAG: globin-coupled sensor protein, partial [Acetobacteraceae bacterium]|nr:globin-coupled sensor protein [Acetobacteraceae bacterium]